MDAILTNRPGVSKEEGATARWRTRLPVVLSALGSLYLIARLWPTLRQSLWLDETVSFWVTSGSLAAVARRAVSYQGQSPLYYGILWVVERLCGSSEMILRLPSLIAVAVTGVFLYRTTLRLSASHDAGAVTVAVFVLTPGVLSSAIDARPYALGLLGVSGAYDSYSEWLVSANRRHLAEALFWVLFAFYCHYFSVVAFAGLPILAIGRFVETRKSLSWRHLMAAALFATLIVLLMAPGFVHMYLLGQRARFLGFAPVPAMSALVSASFPPTVALPLGLCFAVLRLAERPVQKLSGRPALGYFLLLCGTGWLLPPAVAYLLSHTVGVAFVSRYFLSYAVPAALLAGGTAPRVTSAEGRRVASVALWLVALLWCPQLAARPTENWRAAVARANELHPKKGSALLLSSGLIETRYREYLDNTAAQEYLLAPLSYYHPIGTPAVLPYSYDTTALQTYSANVVVTRLPRGAHGVVLVREALYLSNGVPQLASDQAVRWFEANGLRVISRQGFLGVVVLQVESTGSLR